MSTSVALNDGGSGAKPTDKAENCLQKLGDLPGIMNGASPKQNMYQLRRIKTGLQRPDGSVTDSVMYAKINRHIELAGHAWELSESRILQVNIEDLTRHVKEVEKKVPVTPSVKISLWHRSVANSIAKFDFALLRLAFDTSASSHASTQVGSGDGEDPWVLSRRRRRRLFVVLPSPCCCPGLPLSLPPPVSFPTLSRGSSPPHPFSW